MSEKQATSRLTINIERFPDAAIVHCQGELVAGVTDLLYRDVHALSPEVPRIILDLKELTSIDSSGLGMIVRLYASSKSAKCDFALANISGRVRQILGITSLLSVLQVVGENNIRI